MKKNEKMNKWIIITALLAIALTSCHQLSQKAEAEQSKAYVTKRWHVLAIINKIFPFAYIRRCAPFTLCLTFKKQ